MMMFYGDGGDDDDVGSNKKDGDGIGYGDSSAVVLVIMSNINLLITVPWCSLNYFRLCMMICTCI